MIGKTVREADLENRHGLNVIHIHLCCQEGETVSAMTGHRLEPGDELHLEATADAILAAEQTLGLVPVPDRAIQPWEQEPERAAFELAEVVLAPTSSLRGKTLRQIDFRSRFGLAVLAIRHQGADPLCPAGRRRARFWRLAAAPGIGGQDQPAAPRARLSAAGHAAPGDAPHATKRRSRSPFCWACWSS